MPRYYFHIRRHDGFEEDLEGTELSSDDLAFQEAVLAARELMADKVRHGQLVDGDVFEITRETGEIVHSLPLRSVVRFE